MKKFILFGLSLLLTGVAYSGTITTKVYLGPKESGSCQYKKSICTVVTTNLSDPDGTVAIMQLSQDQSSVTVTITDDQSLTLPMDILDAMQQGVFVQVTPFVFTQDVFTSLGYVGTALTIPPNNYTVTHTGAGYVIVFTVVGS